GYIQGDMVVRRSDIDNAYPDRSNATEKLLKAGKISLYSEGASDDEDVFLITVTFQSEYNLNQSNDLFVRNNLLIGDKTAAETVPAYRQNFNYRITDAPRAMSRWGTSLSDRNRSFDITRKVYEDLYDYTKKGNLDEQGAKDLRQIIDYYEQAVLSDGKTAG